MRMKKEKHSNDSRVFRGEQLFVRFALKRVRERDASQKHKNACTTIDTSYRGEYRVS